MVSRPIVFVGNATHDSVFFVSHLPREDEVCAVRETIKCHGGRGVVPALVAAALGLEAELCTVIGHDLKQDFYEFLKFNHIGSAGVKWDIRNSGVTEYFAFIGEETRTSVAVAKAPSLDWRTVKSQQDLVRSARAAYFSTNNLDFNRELLDCVTDGIPVIHNLGIRLPSNPEYLDTMLTKSTLLIGNRIEWSNISSLTGLNPHDMFSSSASLQNIIITAGREGAQLFSRGQDVPMHFAAHEVHNIRSPVGAGDSFAVGVLWSLVSGKNVTEGIRLGMALGALALLSETSYPDTVEVRKVPK